MRRSRFWPLVGLAWSFATCSTPATAQVPGVATAPARAQPAITRADIVAAYRNVDLATAGRTLTGDSTADLNRRVDGATMALRSGRMADGLRALHEAAADYGNVPAARATARQLAGLRVTLTPRVLIRGRADVDPRLELVPRYALRLPDGGAIGDSLRGVAHFTRGAQTVSEMPFAIATTSRTPQSFPVAGDLLRRVDGGRIALAATASPPPAPRADDGRWFVTTRNPDDVRIEVLGRAEMLDTVLAPELLNAAATLRARARSLSAEPVLSLRTSFADNPVALARDVQTELELLVAGGNPYANRYGDHWRVVRLPTSVVPVRVFVPLDVARNRRPAALIVALHDEGGDENTFPDLFGPIIGLAEANRVIVASVNSDAFSGSGADFNGIVAAIQSDVTIDVSRIYVIGHGRGADQATALADTRASLLAGVVCIAGLGRVATGTAVAPMLVFIGEIDPIAASERLRPVAAEAIAAGASIDFRVVANQGHTLIVNAVLPAAIGWLLQHTHAASR